MKPRIFLGSSGQQEKLLQALTRGLQDIADVDPWTTVFNPGVSTLDRLVELTHEVDFAAFVFARDDWTTKGAAPDAHTRRGLPARQRGLRSRPVRRCARHPPHVHPPRGRRQAPLGSPRFDGDPVRPRHDAGDRAPDQPEAAERDRGGRSVEPSGGRLVATVPHGEDRTGAVGDLAPDDQPRSRRRARGGGTFVAGRRHAVRAVLE